MKVLLCEDIEKLGWYGEVVDVKTGYARNYLIPHGLATVPTEENINAMAAEKVKRTEQRRLLRTQLENLVEQVEGAKVEIAAKTNEAGHLFGSVSEADIAQALCRQGFSIKPQMVKMDHHIKEIGRHSVVLKVASDLPATVQVTVTSENMDLPIEDKKTADQALEQEDQAVGSEESSES